ncbi:MAG: DHH family phosphoesterase [Candidatus Pacearchaeota archaeon]
MSQITILQAREFLDRIFSEDKVAIIFHNDPDGYASAVSFSEYLKDKKIEISFFETDTINGIKPYFENLKNFDKLIFTDLAPNVIAKELNNFDKKILYVDHHKKDVEISEHIFEFRTKSCESASMDTFLITGKKKFLTFLGMISDAGWRYRENDDYINENLKEFKINLDEAKKLGDECGFLLKAYKSNVEKTIEILEKIDKPKDFLKLQKILEPIKNELNFFINDFEKNKEKLGKIYFYYFEPKLCGKGVIINQISYSNPDEVFIFTTLKENDIISVSARNQSGEIDCIELLGKTMKGFKNSNSGGHVKAAGGYIQKKDLEEFKEKLKQIN